MEKALDKAEAVIVAVPSASFREVASGLDGFAGIAVSVTKGIEHKTGLTMGGILNETAPGAAVVALSGPSLAAEVARGIPTALVAGSEPASQGEVPRALPRSDKTRVNLPALACELTEEDVRHEPLSNQ